MILKEGMKKVAIPVVVDLLLRHNKIDFAQWEISVAIPVVVDLLLRLAIFDQEGFEFEGRNPCCSGPTASTFTIFGIRSKEWGRNPCCSGPTASTLLVEEIEKEALRSQSLL